MRFKLVAALFTSALALASCGGSGLSAEDQALADALGAAFELDADTSAETQACVGTETVSGIGSDRLSELGVTVDNADDFEPSDLDMTGAERDKLVDVLAGCFDLRRALADSMAGGDEIAGDCVYEALSDEEARTIIRNSVDPDPEAGFAESRAIFEAIQSCFE